VQTTSINPVPLLILGLVFGGLSFAASEGFRKRNGVTPWRWSSIVWGIIGFLSILVCVIMMAIAGSQTKKKLASGAYGPGAGAGEPSGYGYRQPPGGAMPPGYGPSPGYGPGTRYPAPSLAAPAGPPAAASPPAWHPDPGGRHQYRYWDGSHWTEHVSDHGRAGTDPPTP
jgi:hypothetical protein